MSYSSSPNNLNVAWFLKLFSFLFGKINVVVIILTAINFVSLCYAETQGISSVEKWVGTWSTAPQLVETGNNPPSPGLSNNTLRQIVHVSIGGDSLQVRFTNEFSTSPVTMKEVHIAVSLGSGKIDTTTDRIIYFGGKQEVTMAAGSAVVSDPFGFSLQPLSDVAITIYFGSTSPDVSGHPGSRTTSYILSGNNAAKANFTGAVTTDHWYIINTIDVMAPESSFAVAILGNSITDGRGSGTNKQNRWPDELARRFQANQSTKQVAVLNEGIGGNCVLGACLGPSAKSRFKRDVLNQSGIKWVVIFEGINDIGNAFNGTQTAQNLISAYGGMIDSAHARGLLVYGATLTPFGGSSYHSADHYKAWQIVNDWIRSSGRFDGLIDLDAALQDPASTTKMLSTYDSGDHLHPSEAGHHMMAEAVDLSLFGAKDTNTYGITISKSNIEGYYAAGQKWTNFNTTSNRYTMNIGFMGKNSQTWKWPNVSFDSSFVETGVNPSTTPFASEFNMATHAKKVNGVYFDEISKSYLNTEDYQFFQLSDSSLINLGSAVYVIDTKEKKNIVFENSVLLKLPLFYGSQFVCSKDTISISDTKYSVETVLKSVDAFGKISFNNGTFDALRERTDDKTEVFENNLLISTSTIRSYEWYTKNDGIAVLDASTSSYSTGAVAAAGLSLTLFGDLLTAIKDEKVNVPNSFSLSQNYPNPFNPATKIKFSIPHLSFVSLIVFDVLGNEVANLVNEMKIAGNYEVTFSGNKLASGVYFYQLKCDGNLNTKKFVLLK